ncbi:hypothetical protein D9M70_626300 [compost metagenome]
MVAIAGSALPAGLAARVSNDANNWDSETMDNPKYPLELFQLVVTVSLETQKIVGNLPELDR